jgi:hypothetical protein
MHFFSEHSSESDRIALVLRRFEEECRLRAPETIVVEEEFDKNVNTLPPRIAERVAARAKELGMHVHRVSLKRASAVILNGGGTFRRATRALLEQYPALHEAFAPDGKSRLRDHDWWRRNRSLSAAYCLAHATVDQLLLAAALQGTSERPSPYD